MVTSMSVRCPQCFYENEERYRFCGMCGIALPRIGAASEPEGRVTRAVTAAINSHPEAPMAPGRETAARENARETAREAQREPFREPIPGKERPPIPVTGPSFLGLSQDQNPYPDRSLDYLLEDDPHPGRARTYLAVILLLAAVGMLAWRWRHSGIFSQTHPTAAVSPNAAPPNSPDPSPSPAATAPARAANSDPAAGKPASQPNRGSLQESDLPPGGAPANDAPKQSQPAQNNDDQPTGSSPNDSASSTTQPAPSSAATAKPVAAEPPAAVPPAATAKPGARGARPAVQPLASPVPEQDPLEAEGEKYLYGTGVPQNCGRAEKSLLAAAKNANPKAQSVLGTMYATGHCVGRDLPTAYRWFARASHQDPGNARITRDLEVLWKQMTAGERQMAVNNRE
jgi:hypothetical protein